MWKSDYLVKLLNIVVGQWFVERKQGMLFYYYWDYIYNVEEMLNVFVVVCKYYLEWFYLYLWEEFKVSEFFNMVGYVQGFLMNIIFFEGIGFLIKSDDCSQVVFMVIVYEVVYQWWGNFVILGLGVGGNVFLEGMVYYLILLLYEEVLGVEVCIEFVKWIEENYNDRCFVDGERLLVKIDGL